MAHVVRQQCEGLAPQPFVQLFCGQDTISQLRQKRFLLLRFSSVVEGRVGETLDAMITALQERLGLHEPLSVHHIKFKEWAPGVLDNHFVFFVLPSSVGMSVSVSDKSLGGTPAIRVNSDLGIPMKLLRIKSSHALSSSTSD